MTTAMQAPKPKYQPTVAEQAVLDRNSQRRQPGVKMKVAKVTTEQQEGEKPVVSTFIEPDHPDNWVGNMLVMATLGSRDNDFGTAILAQLANISRAEPANGEVDEKAFRGNLAMVQGIQPNDELEAMLATQMVAIHNETMNYVRRMQSAGSTEKRQVLEQSVNRMARTFTAQMEALKKYRSGGPQRVIVEHKHYHLAPGAQAVFGDFTAPGGGGVPEERGNQSHVRSISEREAVHGDLQANGAAVQRPGDVRQERLPVSRGKGRGALRAV